MEFHDNHYTRCEPHSPLATAIILSINLLTKSFISTPSTRAPALKSIQFGLFFARLLLVEIFIVGTKRFEWGSATCGERTERAGNLLKPELWLLQGRYPELKAGSNRLSPDGRHIGARRLPEHGRTSGCNPKPYLRGLRYHLPCYLEKGSRQLVHHGSGSTP